MEKQIMRVYRDDIVFIITDCLSIKMTAPELEKAIADYCDNMYGKGKWILV